MAHCSLLSYMETLPTMSQYSWENVRLEQSFGNLFRNNIGNLVWIFFLKSLFENPVCKASLEDRQTDELTDWPTARLLDVPCQSLKSLFIKSLLWKSAITVRGESARIFVCTRKSTLCKGKPWQLRALDRISFATSELNFSLKSHVASHAFWLWPA